jgi:hypothetical protein
MSGPLAGRREDEAVYPIYVILGTSHQIQWRPRYETPESKLIDGLESAIRGLIAKHNIRLVAEEGLPGFPLTLPCQIAKDQRMCYLQIEMTSREEEASGILEQMEMLRALNSKGDADYRCPRADDIRENYWLDKIGHDPSASRVLVVCGYAHTRFLAKKVRDRGCAAEEVFFPEGLKERKVVELPDC